VYTGNYIVRWRDGSQTVDTSADTTRMRRVESNTGLALSVKRPMAGALQLLTVKDNKGDDPETVAKRLRNDPRVADAVPDRWLRLHDTVPNDPISPPTSSIMAAGHGGGRRQPAARVGPQPRQRSVVIAVVDTGYLPHPDLASRLVQATLHQLERFRRWRRPRQRRPTPVTTCRSAHLL
jgi:serine protease